MSTPIENIVRIDARLGVILNADGIDRGRAIFDEYRTTHADGKDEFVMVLATRLLLEHDRRHADGRVPT